MKLLLYCTKSKPMLRIAKEPMNNQDRARTYTKKEIPYFTQYIAEDMYEANGKIVAECDYEVEKIYYSPMFCNYTTWSLGKDDLLNKSCLTHNELKNYLGTKDVIGNDGYNGYAIHIKNLHIFDEPRDIRNYYTNRIYNKIEDVYTDEIQIKSSEWVRPIKNAPQNMMYAYDNEEKKILISIRPEWLCKILNGEKTIEVRKKVLKEMLK